MIFKHDFKDFIKCERILGLKALGTKEAPINPIVQDAIDEGINLSIYADQLFNQPIHKIPSAVSIKKRLSLTKDALNRHDLIAEAAFTYNGAYAAVDYLEKTDKGYHLYELKAKGRYRGNAEIRDSQNDMAYQAYILSKNGMHLEKITLIHINPDYIRKNDLDIHKLLIKEDHTISVKALFPFVEKVIEGIKNQKTIPDFVPISACNQCVFKHHCFKDLKDDSLVNLYNYREKKEMYLEGNRTLFDVYHNDPKLSDVQKRQIRYHYDDSLPMHFDLKNVQSFMDTIKYPVYYLDFEAIKYLIPPFNKFSPNDDLPYQASIHIKETEKVQLKHEAFLMAPPSDPREPMTNFLMTVLKTSGSIIVYNQGYEKMILNQLKERFPKYQKEIDAFIDRIVDLLDPFRKGYIYHHAMGNSFSIKSIYPAMVPSQKEAYLNLDTIHNGLDAIEGIKALEYFEGEALNLKRKQLLDYCALDTLSMVEIHESLLYELEKL